MCIEFGPWWGAFVTAGWGQWGGQLWEERGQLHRHPEPQGVVRIQWL